MATTVQVTFDCAEPAAMAAFWAGALGYEVEGPPAGFDTWEDHLRSRGVPEGEWGSMSAAVDPEGVGPRLLFVRVPDRKVSKNRVHLDVNVSGPAGTLGQERRTRVDEIVDRLVGQGARVLRPYEQHGEYWVVMHDPEGNEFCVQ